MLGSRLAFAVMMPALMVALTACGRTPGLGNGTDGGITPDQRPILDGWRKDLRPPPPPDFGPWWDLRPPPPPDFRWPDAPRRDGPPPPPKDFGPWPDFPRPPDFGPPTDGPQPDLPPNCNPSCADLCKMVSDTCGILPNGQCMQQCSTWTPTQYKCASLQYCVLGFVDCAVVKGCISLPWQQPDLVVKFSASVGGDTIKYVIDTCNVGGIAAGPYFVDVYYDRPNPPGLQQFGDQFQQYPGLPPGACQQTVLSRTGTPAGTYTSWAQVDADGQVSESNESNNVGGPIKLTVQGPPPPIGPDLVINTVTTSVTGTTSATVRYQINVCNKGQTASGGTQVHVYYDRPVAPKQGESGDQFTTVPGLQPGACTNRNIYRSGTPPGTFNSWAQVDPLNIVIEAVETNNVSGPHPVVVGSSVGADLRIDSFTAQTIGSSTVVYTIRVCNVGTGSAGATDVQVYYNSATAPPAGSFGDKLTTVAQLAPSACSNRTISRSGTPPGTYTSWARVDVQNAVTETNENNNDAGPTKVTVNGTPTQPDLRITQFSAKPSGTTVYYSAVVCNQGTSNAGFSRIDFYYDRNSQPNQSVNGDQSSSLPPLAVGACTNVDRQRTGTPNGTYNSWARVDRLNQVTESNENNNVAGPVSVSIGVTPPPPPINCPSVCQSAIQCGMFNIAAFPQCLSWCGALNPTQQACVVKTTNPLNCTLLQTCAPLPPPPPPPPPGFCSGLCSWLQSPCNLLPAGQQATCQSVCGNLTPAQVTCAQTAQAAGQCLNALLCVFN